MSAEYKYEKDTRTITISHNLHLLVPLELQAEWIYCTDLGSLAARLICETRRLILLDEIQYWALKFFDRVVIVDPWLICPLKKCVKFRVGLRVHQHMSVCLHTQY